LPPIPWILGGAPVQSAACAGAVSEGHTAIIASATAPSAAIFEKAGAFPWAIHRSISQSAPPSRDTRMTRDAAGVPALPPATEASMIAVTADVNERTTRAVRGRAMVAKC
jgi:hypothetical protein